MLLGPLPGWAHQIDHLTLSSIDFQGSRMLHVPLHGGLYLRTVPVDTVLNNRRLAQNSFLLDTALVAYRLVNSPLAGRRFTFTTEAIAGVSFAFDGEFAQRVKGEEVNVALTGRLSRLEHGRVVAEFEARFTYYAGE